MSELKRPVNICISCNNCYGSYIFIFWNKKTVVFVLTVTVAHPDNVNNIITPTSQDLLSIDFISFLMSKLNSLLREIFTLVLNLVNYSKTRLLIIGKNSIELSKTY